ncbi:ABC transporter ATP-binding protein [Horticoccus sp. 23ND18S-11]|uniref:ABC transporter ATP-binding protein n=1 Tax=Horticoccus sp. 23ND18S-11 TaxID=3391832 RepID=UPI0039C978BE
MPAHVIVRDLRKAYAGVEAVRGVSFTIEAGEIFGLLGPNGAGKTTTVECLVGLREPDAGDIEVCGLDARLHPREVKQKIGVALQSTSLQDKITPREALRLFGAFYRERVAPETLLERFALVEKADARVETLSGGQRQRLALALAFVNRPQLVFLDEPTTGLDPQTRHELHAAILQMKRDGYTVLFTTHYLDEAEQLCDRVAIIDQGRIVASGTPRELIAEAHGLQSVSLVTSRPVDLARLGALAGVSDIVGMSTDGAGVRFHTSDAVATLGALTRWLAEARVEVIELQVRKGSLEDVFLGLTRSHEEAGGAKR